MKRKILCFMVLINIYILAIDIPSFDNFESFGKVEGKVKELRLYWSSTNGRSVEETLKNMERKRTIFFNEKMKKIKVTYSDEISNYSETYNDKGEKIYDGENTYDKNGRLTESIKKLNGEITGKTILEYSDKNELINESYYIFFDGHFELELSSSYIYENGLMVEERRDYGGVFWTGSNKTWYSYNEKKQLVKMKFKFNDSSIYSLTDVSYDDLGRVKSIVYSSNKNNNKLESDKPITYKYFLLNKDTSFVVEYEDDIPFYVYKQEIIR